MKKIYWQDLIWPVTYFVIVMAIFLLSSCLLTMHFGDSKNELLFILLAFSDLLFSFAIGWAIFKVIYKLVNKFPPA